MPNALAPEVQNNLFDPSELYDFLTRANALPSWSKTTPYMGASGAYYPAQNQLIASDPSVSRFGTRTIAHEMTHATQAELDRVAASLREKEWSKKELAPEEKQFLQGYLRIMGSLPGRVGQLDTMGKQTTANKNVQRQLDALSQSNTWGKEYRPYRTSIKEAQAFGVEGSSKSYGERPALGPPHMDPTMATEMAILMSLYEKLPKSTLSAIDRQFKAPESVPETRYYPPVTGYPDPFKGRK